VTSTTLVADSPPVFRHARDLAAAQKVRSLELRAAMSLADLSRRFGAPNDGRAQLAEVYGRFSEGFQSSDLRCAKAILDFTD
jgi:hypothetical protein